MNRCANPSTPAAGACRVASMVSAWAITMRSRSCAAATAALTMPEFYAEELRAFFRPYRRAAGGSARSPRQLDGVSGFRQH